MKIELLKCHGSGNVFYLIDEIKQDYGFSEQDRIELSCAVCSKEGPLGADGILFLLPSSKAQGRMRIFNSDGSEAEMCGNGLRCIGRYVMEALKEQEATIETMKASYLVKHVDDIYENVYTVEILIDTIDFNVKALPLNYQEDVMLFKKLEDLSDAHSFSAVSITNPHLVAIVDSIDDQELKAIGIKANNNKQLLPKGTNVNFVKILDEDSIFVRTYERGVGLTPSCGTGITASSVVAALYNDKLLGRPLRVINEGGMISCTVHNDSKGGFQVKFMGNASYISDLNIEYNKGSFSIIGREEAYAADEKSYSNFKSYVKEKLMK